MRFLQDIYMLQENRNQVKIWMFSSEKSKKLRQDCNFKDCTAKECEDKAICKMLSFLKLLHQQYTKGNRE